MVERSQSTELGRLDGLAQANLVRSGEVSARELVQSAIDRIEAGNARINAVVHRRFEEALNDSEQSVRNSQAPFAGVPFLLKDEGCQAGVVQTHGNIALKALNYTSATDEALGRRFRSSGLITVGVSNIPEFGQLGDTQPLAYGPTRNPWCTDRSASGSSGGAAAAVAAGFVPIAHGSDGAGSIRQPAAWCGVFGMKPSRGLMPRPEPALGDIWSTASVITRTVRDTAAALDAVSGALVGDLYGLPPRTETLTSSLAAPRGALRVGIVVEGPGDMAVHPDCVRGVEQVAAVLRDAGHQVEYAHPAALFEPIPAWVDQSRRDDNTRQAIGGLQQLLGRAVTEDDVEPLTWAWFMASAPVSADELRASVGWHLARSARVLQWWEHGWDLLVTPVVNELPDRLDDLAAQSPEDVSGTERRHATFLEPFNASGQPAAAFPALWNDDGLPVGVQIVAARGQDALILSVAAQLEEAIEWPSRTTPEPGERGPRNASTVQ